ncbi:hypothetical protein [Kitasatospora camelliae]|uniref:Tyr recombinase domain-containing protein n=1 Tax=Kitasatospora camelliae TaxID=3156397 RepID=A0AAU8K7D9_9ACTN
MSSALDQGRHPSLRVRALAGRWRGGRTTRRSPACPVGRTAPRHPDGTPKQEIELTAEERAELSFFSGETVNTVVKKTAKAAFTRIAHLTANERVEHGYNALRDAATAGKVPAHGLRAGGATELKEAGASDEQIAELGDWAKGSKAMQRYFRAIKVREDNPWAAARQARCMA